MTCFMALLLDSGRRQIGAFARGQVLEIGVGTGLNLKHDRVVARVTGIDLSTKMMEVARVRVEEAGVPVELCLMDAQRLAFPDHVFDAVVFSLCLCTIPNQIAAIEEAVRVVRPDGRMVFLEHVRSANPIVALIQDALNPLTVHFQQDHLNRRTVELVERQGMEIERLTRWGLGISCCSPAERRIDRRLRSSIKQWPAAVRSPSAVVLAFIRYRLRYLIQNSLGTKPRLGVSCLGLCGGQPATRLVEFDLFDGEKRPLSGMIRCQ